MKHRELATLFRAERARFARWYPSCSRAWLSLSDTPCPLPPCSSRDYGAANLDTGEITFSFRVLLLPRANVVGLIRHELGHLADPTPNARNAERRADRIAGRVGGVPIRYDADLVQTIDQTAPYRARPASLHR